MDANKVINIRQLPTLLSNMGADLTESEGNVRVYTSKRLNVTLTVFPTARPDQVRVQMRKGCTC